LHAAHCHCGQCQKQSGAAFITGILYPYEAVRWAGEEPNFYRSSEGAKRGFCARCGSWLNWHWKDEKIMLTVGSFDSPGDAVEPTFHVFVENQVPWLKLDDDLPRHARYAPDMGGQDQGL